VILGQGWTVDFAVWNGGEPLVRVPMLLVLYGSGCGLRAGAADVHAPRHPRPAVARRARSASKGSPPLLALRARQRCARIRPGWAGLVAPWPCGMIHLAVVLWQLSKRLSRRRHFA